MIAKQTSKLIHNNRLSAALHRTTHNPYTCMSSVLSANYSVKPCGYKLLHICGSEWFLAVKELVADCQSASNVKLIVKLYQATGQSARLQLYMTVQPLITVYCATYPWSYYAEIFDHVWQHYVRQEIIMKGSVDKTRWRLGSVAACASQNLHRSPCIIYTYSTVDV